ncbi:MAG: GIY-YIG nuclease family protein [Flavobacteriaceae bacterium]|nr:GIY-YIG nuclease family protein [Flavobacteriaceae bacterium]
MQKTGFVYIIASKRNGTLYIGVTNDIRRRVQEHKTNLNKWFTEKYGCKTLVWYERFEDIRMAIAREKKLKKWLRNWKLELIEQQNPDWKDLSKGW